jgi:hypothetical protein
LFQIKLDECPPNSHHCSSHASSMPEIVKNKVGTSI